MRHSVYLHQAQAHKFPTTYVYSLLEGDLLVILRPWGSQDYNQKFLDEITHYLSSAMADVDVTSPFDYDDHLTSLTNKLKIALLIAHDFFYKTENKTTYGVGLETALLFKSKNEISWACVGRFDLYEMTNNQIRSISVAGSDLDTQQNVLLPLDLLGLEKDFALRCGSIQNQEQMKLVVASIFGSTNVLPTDKGNEIEEIFSQTDDSTSLWSTQVILD